MSKRKRVFPMVVTGAVLALAAVMMPGNSAAQSVGNFDYISRNDGGVDVKFSSGCWISYNSQARRGGHAGSCSNQQFARADEAAYSYLGGQQSGSQGAPMPQLAANSDGGVDARFQSGCWISYDRNARRGGHAGACSDREYARADSEAAAYMRTRPSGNAGLAAPKQDFADSFSGGPDFWHVNAGSLNMRAGPSTSYGVLRALGRGERVRNLGCGVSGGQRWCRVETTLSGRSVVGFVAQQYLQEGPVSVAAPRSPAPDYADSLQGGPDYWAVTGLTAGDTLNVRSAPSGSSNILATLSMNEIVRNLGCTMSGGQRWCRIQSISGMNVTGFVSGRYLRESGAPMGGAANSNPSSGFDLAGFEGGRAGQAEGGLRNLGYELSRTRGLTAYWYNRMTGVCAEIVTSNGRYSSVRPVAANNCK